METKRCQRCHKLLRLEAQVCSRCGGHDFISVAATRSRQTVKLTLRQDEVSLPSTPPASPHRAGHYSGLHPEDQPYQSSFLPVLRPHVAAPPAIAEEPEALTLSTREDTYATMAEPFDAPVTKRRVATFTPLPEPRQQRGLQTYPASPAHSPMPIASQDDVEIDASTAIDATTIPPPTREPMPLMLRPAPRRGTNRGVIIPVLLALSCFLFLGATSILAFLLVNNKPTPAALSPVMYAEPAALRPDDLLIISGKRFPANDLLRFTRDTNVPIDQNGKQLVVNAFSTGYFAVQIKVPLDWSVGSHTIFATDQQNYSTSVTIQIEPPSSKPPHLQLSASRIDAGADNINAITQSQLTLTNTGGGKVHWAAKSDSSWLSSSPQNGSFSGSEGIKITVNRDTLAPLSYIGHLTFTQQPPAPALSLTLTVTMSVNPAPPTAPNLALSSAALAFSGTPLKNPAGQVLTLQNTGGQALNWTAATPTTGGGNWLAVVPSSGTLSAGQQTTVAVSAVTTGLSAANYAGTLIFTYAGSSASVAVTLAVSPLLQPALSVLPTGGLTFNAIQGQNPPPQSFTISNPGTASLDWGITEDTNGQAYAKVSQTRGTLAAGNSILITVTPSITQLTASTVGAVIAVSDTDAGSAIKKQQIGVTFVIVNQAQIGLNTNQLPFSHTASITISTVSITLTDTGSQTLNWAVTISNSSTVQWLIVDSTTTSGSLVPSTVTFVNVTCDSTQLSPGTYTATIQIYDTDPGTPVHPQTVTVTVVVL